MHCAASRSPSSRPRPRWCRPGVPILSVFDLVQMSRVSRRLQRALRQRDLGARYLRQDAESLRVVLVLWAWIANTDWFESGTSARSSAPRPAFLGGGGNCSGGGGPTRVFVCHHSHATAGGRPPLAVAHEAEVDVLGRVFTRARQLLAVATARGANGGAAATGGVPPACTLWERMASRKVPQQEHGQWGSATTVVSAKDDSLPDEIDDFEVYNSGAGACGAEDAWHSAGRVARVGPGHRRRCAVCGPLAVAELNEQVVDKNYA
ncbi:hypothetical protein HK405_003807 [Cladochytrium tenue]|nr:hypothetical protein HK405_003807 [Cladochytrium tenue]